MRVSPKRRLLLVILHDGVATIIAVLLSFFLRFDEAGLAARYETLLWFLPGYVVYAAGVYSFFQLYRTRWRFASLPDLVNIFRAATVLALSLLAFDYILASSAFSGRFLFGKITLFLYWLLQIVALGAGRISYRYYRYARARRVGRSKDNFSALLVGNAAEAEVVLRGIESGAVKRLTIVGILSPAQSDEGQVIRHAPVLGMPHDLDQVVIDLEQNQQRPHRLILLPSAFADGAAEQSLMVARRLDIPAQRLPLLQDAAAPGGDGALRLHPIDIEDLLFRESVAIDYDRLRNFIEGRRIAVTGGAGSIGSEICERALELGATELLILDHAEAALYEIGERLNSRKRAIKILTSLADVRDRARVERLLAAFSPELVFHAAALKHVPIVEQDWAEGLRTNLLGTVNVCQAALAAKARTIVVISTDKAVEPVSVLGVSKRFGELYAAALDRDAENGTRVISVRFGNVLGSSGSVVPLFKTQIAAGGPVTVTHQAMVRYFMTAREACDLVLTAADHAAKDESSSASVYVLDMGQPVRILDLAERMIRLSGYAPDRDIRIEITGIRPGERLQENLFARAEKLSDIGISGVSAALGEAPSIGALERTIEKTKAALNAQDRAAALAALRVVITDMRA